MLQPPHQPPHPFGSLALLSCITHVSRAAAPASGLDTAFRIASCEAAKSSSTGSPFAAAARSSHFESFVPSNAGSWMSSSFKILFSGDFRGFERSAPGKNELRSLYTFIGGAYRTYSIRGEERTGDGRIRRGVRKGMRKKLKRVEEGKGKGRAHSP